MHGYANFAEFGGPINNAMRPKKQPNAAATSIRSVHCSHDLNVNVDTNVG